MGGVKRRLVQFPSFPGRQFSQGLPALTQAHRKQVPVLLHLQQVITTPVDVAISAVFSV